jgi:hypothetical protein
VRLLLFIFPVAASSRLLSSDGRTAGINFPPSLSPSLSRFRPPSSSHALSPPSPSPPHSTKTSFEFHSAVLARDFLLSLPSSSSSSPPARPPTAQIDSICEAIWRHTDFVSSQISVTGQLLQLGTLCAFSFSSLRSISTKTDEDESRRQPPSQRVLDSPSDGKDGVRSLPSRRVGRLLSRYDEEGGGGEAVVVRPFPPRFLNSSERRLMKRRRVGTARRSTTAVTGRGS